MLPPPAGPSNCIKLFVSLERIIYDIRQEVISTTLEDSHRTGCSRDSERILATHVQHSLAKANGGSTNTSGV